VRLLDESNYVKMVPKHVNKQIEFDAKLEELWNHKLTNHYEKFHTNGVNSTE
jgi:hypothetical protein